MSSIDLSGNPIDCSCQILWLKDVLSAINETEVTAFDLAENSEAVSESSVICESPEEFKGLRLLEDVSRSDLECSSNLVTGTTNFVLTTFTGRSRADQLILVSICVSAALTLGLIMLVGVHG